MIYGKPLYQSCSGQGHETKQYEIKNPHQCLHRELLTVNIEGIIYLLSYCVRTNDASRSKDNTDRFKSSLRWKPTVPNNTMKHRKQATRNTLKKNVAFGRRRWANVSMKLEFDYLTVEEGVFRSEIKTMDFVLLVGWAERLLLLDANYLRLVHNFIYSSSII